ncbi:Thiamine kinase [Pelagimonas phthalicica]|uniref:Thiamine kinase n=1 Tax=Pelagimonas phthalicica TaxID=1037362 RepID=A0A238JC58_9RHOB|nr:aminoglycoside phosphotransferase family protein [Pelagimonas phthalicica]TDS91232.1 streptomycin 6-kinase [Pelagimonas phthalicica]SMX28280.1 Thiamine kinase [Pelagimonas phthalicica]
MDLEQALPRFDLHSAMELTQTKSAALWRVQDRHGRDLVLKLYHGPDPGNEASGLRFMQAVAQIAPNLVPVIYRTEENAVAMEYVVGQPLGDALRRGDYMQEHSLLDTARQLHAHTLQPISGLPHLADWFQRLFNLRFASDCPSDLKADMQRAQELASALLATQRNVRPLHGDLHHDNLIGAGSCYKLIDAKGVLGEPEYELANALRNPKGCETWLRDKDQQKQRQRACCAALSLDPKRFAQWVAAKCACSIALRSGGVLKADPEADLLNMFLALADEV